MRLLNYLRMIYLKSFFVPKKQNRTWERCTFVNTKRLSELSGLTEPIISNTRTLKGRITDKFSDDISFYPKDKYFIVHNSDVHPCEYVLATLKGKGFKDYDIIKSYGKMIWRKFKTTAEEKQSPQWSYSPQEIVEMLDIMWNLQYNFYTVHGNYGTNKYGCANTESSELSTKIWSVACDWEASLKK